MYWYVYNLNCFLLSYIILAMVLSVINILMYFTVFDFNADWTQNFLLVFLLTSHCILKTLTIKHASSLFCNGKVIPVFNELSISLIQLLSTPHKSLKHTERCSQSGRLATISRQPHTLTRLQTADSQLQLSATSGRHLSPGAPSVNNWPRLTPTPNWTAGQNCSLHKASARTA
jgi:hypothetical protein